MPRGETPKTVAAGPALREQMQALPLPLAQLVRRIFNGKSPADRHHSAFYLAECALKLAASARIGLWLDRALAPGSPIARRLAVLALPSTGHWCELLREVSGALAELSDAALLPLASEANELGRRRPEWAGVRAFAERSAAEGVIGDEVAKNALRRGIFGFFDLVVAYRNEVVGHGAQRAAGFYEEFGDRLLGALAEVLACPALLGGLTLAQARLEVTSDGADSRTVWYGLTGLAGLPFEEDASGAAPGHLYFIGKGARVPLHPLVVYRQEDDLGREQVGLLNRTVRRTRKVEGGVVDEVRRADYLDYSSGQTLAGVDARAALAALFSRLHGADASGSDVDAAVAATAAEPGGEPQADVVAAGAVIGDFELLGEIGRGSMGVVYKARQLSLGRVVALKVLPPALAADAVARRRFKKEIAALGRCDHPNVVKILASGSDGDRAYYAMEYVNGADLGRAGAVLSSWKSSSQASLKEGHLPLAVATGSGRGAPPGGAPPGDPENGAAGERESGPGRDATPAPLPPPPPPITSGRALADRLIELFADAADGLAHLHDNGILHRDLKPSNLMLTADARRIVIMDLGLARFRDESSALTSSDVKILGTLRYMAPEQLQRRLLDVDERADVYGLGAALYELATGRAIFDGDTEQRLIQQVLNEEPAPVRAIEPSIRRDLATVIEAAIQKSPDRRYPSARAFADDLRAALAHRPIQARRARLAHRAALFLRRNRAAAALAALVILITAGGVWYWTRVRVRVVHYADQVMIHGVLRGVGEVGGPDGRRDTLRHHVRGDRVMAIECVNGHGIVKDTPIFASARYSYAEDGALTERVDRNKSGRVIARHIYSWKDGALLDLRLDRHNFPAPGSDDVAMYRFELDARGYLSRVLFFNDRGSPRQHLGVYGYTVVADARGRPVEYTFRSLDGRPAPRRDGVARATMRYDERGELIEQAFFDASGAPARSRAGFARTVDTLDARGNPVERAFFGPDGAPVIQKDGVALWRFAYDAHGNMVGRSAFGTDLAPIELPLGFASYRARFDERGNEIERSHFDVGGAPATIKEGFSIYRSRFDEQSREIERAFFGPDGAPRLNKGGYAILRTRYDERGNVTETASFGADGLPILLNEGRAAVRFVHDDRDNEVEKAYFGVDGARIVARDGCAIWRMKYNDRGREIERSCLDEAERPRLAKEGWATVRFRYDDRGLPVERSYHGLTGERAPSAEGYAIVRSEHDDRGDEIAQRFFGPDEAPAARKDGAVRWQARYDDLGKVIERKLFGKDGAEIPPSEAPAAAPAEAAARP